VFVDTITHVDTDTHIGPTLHQSCPWVGLTHGLGWVVSGWVEIFSVFGGLDWVHYSKRTKNLKGSC